MYVTTLNDRFIRLNKTLEGARSDAALDLGMSLEELDMSNAKIVRNEFDVSAVDRATGTELAKYEIRSANIGE